MAIFTNQATLSYNNTVTNSNIVTGEILPALSMTKTAVIDEYSPSGSVTYVLSIVNSGSTAFTGLTVTDNLGVYSFNSGTLYPLDYVAGSLLYYVNGVLQSAPMVTAGPPLRITGIQVPAGGNVTLLYVADVNQFAPPGTTGSITNTATVTGAGLNPVTASETVTAGQEASLTISKSLSPTTVTENGRLTYSFIIQNFGNTPIVATDDAVITDTFNPILSDLAVTFNGVTWTSPANYTYNPVTGVFTTVPGPITVPAATYTQDPTTGAWIINPGVSVLTVSGTV